MSPAVWLSRRLVRSAARRLGPGGADWSRAMAAELESCRDEGERLRWAFGCWRGSFAAPGAAERLAYPLALALALALLTAFEWAADEGPATYLLLGGLSLTLGLLRPSRALASGALIGLVVSGVLAFECATGVRPAYETHPVSLGHSLHWAVLLAPALMAANLGGKLARRLRPTTGA